MLTEGKPVTSQVAIYTIRNSRVNQSLCLLFFRCVFRAQVSTTFFLDSTKDHVYHQENQPPNLRQALAKLHGVGQHSRPSSRAQWTQKACCLRQWLGNFLLFLLLTKLTWFSGLRHNSKLDGHRVTHFGGARFFLFCIFLFFFPHICVGIDVVRFSGIPGKQTLEEATAALSAQVGAVDQNTYFLGQSAGNQIIARYLANLPEGSRTGGFFAVAAWIVLQAKTQDTRWNKFCYGLKLYLFLEMLGWMSSWNKTLRSFEADSMKVEKVIELRSIRTSTIFQALAPFLDSSNINHARLWEVCRNISCLVSEDDGFNIDDRGVSLPLPLLIFVPRCWECRSAREELGCWCWGAHCQGPFHLTWAPCWGPKVSENNRWQNNCFF